MRMMLQLCGPGSLEHSISYNNLGEECVCGCTVMLQCLWLNAQASIILGVGISARLPGGTHVMPSLAGT